MMADFNYVRLKSDHNKIVMMGYCDFTNQFDDILYEQINEPLPETYQVFKIPNLKNELFSIFIGLPLDLRCAFYPLTTIMNHALINDDFEAAGRMLELTSVPDYLISLKNQGLEYFNIINKQDSIIFSDSIQDVVE